MRVIKRSTNLLAWESVDNKKSRHFSNRFVAMPNLCRFEHLSNDLFYEIFEYLDGLEILQSFSGLNFRFEKLIFHPSLRLKIHVDDRCRIPAVDFSHRILLDNAHRFISIHLQNEVFIKSFLDNFPFHLHFQHLESLILDEIPLKKLQPILQHLKFSSRLNALNVVLAENNPSDVDVVYGFAFSFPHLKSLTVNVSIDWEENDTLISSRFPLPQRSKSIRSLTIKHSLTFVGLESLLQFTPELQRLECQKLLQPNRYKDRHRHLTLHHLKFIEIRLCLIEFFYFESLMQNIGRAMEILKLTVGFDDPYLNGYRWETLITQSMPNLKRFYLIVDEVDDLDRLALFDGIHRFTSSFWFERNWTSQFKITSDNTRFSIVPFAKQWIDMHEETESNLSPPLTCHLEKNLISSTLIHLIAQFESDDDDNLELLNEVQQFIGSIKFNQLTMNSSSPSSIDLLLMIIDRSPFLDSLVLSFDHSLDFDEHSVALQPVNTIKKLKIIQPVDVQLIEYFLYFFPKLEFLETDCSSYANLMRFVRLILMKNIHRLPNLRSLCFNIAAADDKMTLMLRRTIEQETNIHLRPLKRVGEQIFLRWTTK